MFYVTMLSCTNMVVHTKICTTEKIPAIIIIPFGHFLAMNTCYNYPPQSGGCVLSYRTEAGVVQTGTSRSH